MKKINLNDSPNSPIVCALYDKEISLLNAIEIRNQLNEIIVEYQKHFLKKHVSNANGYSKK